jgi:hypothetical protein
VVHENDELETPMPALSMLTALMLLPVSAVAQNEEPAQLLEYMKDAWAQVRNDNNKSQTGWVPLDKLSCI